MHVYAHLFDEESSLGQLRQLRPAPFQPVIPPRLRPSPPVLRTPPRTTSLTVTNLWCPGSMSVSEGHRHRIEMRVSTPEGGELPLALAQWIVSIPRLDVDAGAQKTYTTTLDDGHTHTLTLTAADMQTLRSGGTVRKQTSTDARRGGRRHSHEVSISCPQSGLFSVSVPGT